MKRPSFQFYPADWRNNAKLRRCSWAARGAWAEVMGLFHDSDEYGLLRWPLKEIAQALGCPLALLKELAEKGVLKGADKGVVTTFIYTPTSGRKAGPAVTLIPEQEGPIWYCSRMVRDEYIRQKKANFELYKDSPNYSPNKSPDPSPMPPIGEGISAAPMPPKSDLPTSTSSSTSKNSTNTSSSGDDVRQCPAGTLVDLYHELMPSNPRVKVLNKGRIAAIRGRWTEAAGLQAEPFGYATKADGLEAWRRFFTVCAQSNFLVGKAPAQPGKPPFIADIDFIFSPSGFAKILENKYHRDA